MLQPIFLKMATCSLPVLGKSVSLQQADSTRNQGRRRTQSAEVVIVPNPLTTSCAKRGVSSAQESGSAPECDLCECAHARVCLHVRGVCVACVHLCMCVASLTPALLKVNWSSVLEDRNTNQQNRLESPEKNLHIYGQVSFNRAQGHAAGGEPHLPQTVPGRAGLLTQGAGLHPPSRHTQELSGVEETEYKT